MTKFSKDDNDDFFYLSDCPECLYLIKSYVLYIIMYSHMRKLININKLINSNYFELSCFNW